MTSTFHLSERDLLCLSLSVNGLYFLQLLSSRVVHWVLPRLATRGSRWRTLHGLHQRWPDLLGRLLMEQLSLFVLLVLSLVNLGFVTSVIPPFSHHPEVDEADDDWKYDNNNNYYSNRYHPLTRVILCVGIARFLLISVGILQNNTPVRISSTNTRNPAIDWIYCLFGAVSNLMGMGYKQNLLLLVTSSFMELNTTSLVTCRLIKLADRHRCCRSYFKTSVLCCASFLFSRILLPVLFLSHALAQESPFVMDDVPLVWFFVSGVFYLVFHAVFMFYSVRRIVRASAFLSEGASHSCSVHEPFSVCNYSQRLMNDIYTDCGEIPEFDVEKEASFDDDDLKFKCKPTRKLRDLNYGFLAPYDNRNLCSFVTGVEEEKMNFLQKNSSKNELVYKFLIKGDRISDGECYCKHCNKDGSDSDFEFSKDVEMEVTNSDRPSPEPDAT